MKIQELTRDYPASLQLAVAAYLQDHGMEPAGLLRVDLVLVLLRIGTGEALERAAELTGKPIIRCPSGMPPWPPKPCAAPRTPAGPKVSEFVQPNPCPPLTDMHRRYDLVRKGLTREQLIARGVQARDIRYWQNKGHVVFS